MGTQGISGNDALRYLNSLNSISKPQQTGSTAETTNVSANKPIELTASVTREDLATTIENISGQVRANSPEAQGLASAREIEQGHLVSGYTFDNINSLGGKFDKELFNIKYANTNAARVANGINYASEGVEYATVASHLQAKDSPFAELFS